MNINGPKPWIAKYSVRFAVMPTTSSQTSMMTEQAAEGVSRARRKFGGGGQASFGGERLDFGLHDLHAQFADLDRRATITIGMYIATAMNPMIQICDCQV